MSMELNQKLPLLEGKEKKPLDIFGFVFRYGLIIVVAGLSLTTMLVPIVLLVSKPNYETRAVLKIDPVVPAFITRSEELSITGFYHDYTRTQARRMTEFDVLLEAIERLSEDEKAAVLPAHLTAEECVPILRAIMRVEPVSGTHLVELSISGAKKEGLAPVLNSVMEVYLEKMRDEMVDKDKHRLDYLITKKEELTNKISAEEQDIQTLATKANTSTFAEDFNLWQERTSELQKSYVHMYSERVKAENDYLTQKNIASQLGQLSLSSLVEEGVMEDRAIGFTSSWTYQQLQDMRASIDGVTKDNIDRKRVESRMQAMRDYENSLRAETRDTINDIVYGKRSLDLAKEAIVKENKFQERLKSEEMIEDALKNASEMSGNNSMLLLQGQALEVQLAHDRDMLFRIDTRIHEMEAESRAPLRVTIEAPARNPENPAGSNTKKLLMLCIAASFGAVGGLFALIELLDNRIHSPKNIIHALGHPPSWPISRSPAGVSFLNVIEEGGSSVTAKALRSLATRLFREFSNKQSQTFLFTSIDSKCGNTEILLNTAQVLACHVPKVLVIDGNPFKADLYEKLQVPESFPTLNDLLDGRTTFQEAVFHDKERSLDVIVSKINEGKQFHTQQLMALLNEAKERYDIICIDSSPVRSSDFTEFLAVHADVGVITSLGGSTMYNDLRHTAEILIRLGIPALAPVLNWGGVKKKTWIDEYLDRLPTILKKFAGQTSSNKNKKTE